MAYRGRAWADEAEVKSAHSTIGGFIARCSALDYRTGQLIARWFCTGDKQRYLSYVLHSMPFEQKRQIVEERLTRYHASPSDVRAAMKEVAAVIARRDLVASGLLSRFPGGGYCIKSFSGARFLDEPGEEDIIGIEALPEWSERATRLSEQLIAIGDQLAERAA